MAVRVAICAPAAQLNEADAAKVQALAASHYPALDLYFHPQCHASEGHFAGNDALRLSALLDCANDPQFDAVWFARGGYGSNRIAEAAIAGMNQAARTKRYLGYSDCGYLLAALYRAGIGHAVHAPMPADVRRTGGDEAVLRAMAFLIGDSSGLEPSLQGQQLDQPVVAFNLMTLAMLCGTPLMPDLSGHVVMVEEVSEHLYAVDRLFFHVTAHLKDIAGLKLGRVSDVPENDRAFGSEADQIASYWCRRHAIPYIGQADIGHDAANKIVPFGLVSRRIAS